MKYFKIVFFIVYTLRLFSLLFITSNVNPPEFIVMNFLSSETNESHTMHIHALYTVYTFIDKGIMSHFPSYLYRAVVLCASSPGESFNCLRPNITFVNPCYIFSRHIAPQESSRYDKSCIVIYENAKFC